MSLIALIVLALIAAHRTMALVLLAAQGKRLTSQRRGFPKILKGLIDPRTFQKSLDYNLAKTRMAVIEEVEEAAIIFILLFSGVLSWIYGLLTDGLGRRSLSLALFVLSPFLLTFLAQLPLDAWRTFKVEAAFGFNRSSPRLWLADQLKNTLVAAMALYPMVLALLVVSSSLGAWWWLAGFALLAAYQLLLILLYPRVIMPMFYKFSPLKSGLLKARLLRLASRLDFGLQGIYVMNSSRRSSHSNAFFTGWGRFRRVVLFDTLLKQLGASEIESVLAHEIGHYKHRDVVKSLLLSLISSFLGFAVVRLLQLTPIFGLSFGFPEHNLAVVLALVTLIAGSVIFWISPLSMALSRRWEFQADAYAARHVGARPGASALRKIQSKNLGNYLPHPWVVAFHYDHPPVVERLRKLK